MSLSGEGVRGVVGADTNNADHDEQDKEAKLSDLRQHDDALSRRARERKYVARRTVSSAVVVAARHPVVGLVYWRFVDESSVNLPDHYGLTTSIDLAYRFKAGAVPFVRFKNEIHDRNTMEGVGGHDDEYGPYDVVIPTGDFRSIAGSAGLEAAALRQWFEGASWVECPAPPVIRYIADFDGYLGYRPVWTDRIGEALRFSPSDLGDEDDLDVQMARSLAQFVEVDETGIVELPRPIGQGSGPIVNHALEADVAWTLFRLKLGGFNEREAWKRTAFQHAAGARRAYVLDGRAGPTPGHLAPFPELVDAFETGAAVQKRCNELVERP